MDEQLSFFDEADTLFDPNTEEPEADEVISARPHKKKTKGQRNIDLKDFPEEFIPTHGVSKDTLDAFCGKGNWKRMPDEIYKSLRHEPES